MMTRCALLVTAFMLLLSCLLANTADLHAQSNGAVEVKVTTVSYGGKYEPKNIGVIWVENAQGSFIKTLEVWAKKRIQHLVKWQNASNENTVDAVTSATLRSHESHVANWDLTDTNGATVSDGVYKVFIEFTEDNSSKSDKPEGKWTMMEFTKGGADQSVTLPDNSFFKNVRLTYSSSGGGGTQLASVAGRVLEADNRNPVAIATVALKANGATVYETTTTQEGAYQLVDVQSGTYDLVASKFGFNTSSERLSLATGQNVSGKDILLVTAEDSTPPAPPRNISINVR